MGWTEAAAQNVSSVAQKLSVTSGLPMHDGKWYYPGNNAKDNIEQDLNVSRQLKQSTTTVLTLPSRSEDEQGRKRITGAFSIHN